MNCSVRNQSEGRLSATLNSLCSRLMGELQELVSQGTWISVFFAKTMHICIFRLMNKP